MTSKDKFFPIRTETACRLKWAWSTIYLNSGATASCHRASATTLTEENFLNFHNTENKINDRRIMLEGNWPAAGCEYCRDIELVGGKSDRLVQLDVPNEYPHELDNDITATVATPTIVEVFFNNTCNLSCLYCNASLSSQIAKEELQFGSPMGNADSHIFFKNDQYDKLVPLFWQWLDIGYSNLQRLNILGGEPFLQIDFYKLLDYIEKNPNPKLKLSIVTNLIIKKTILESFSKKIKEILAARKLKTIEILVSVDCWGPEQEFIRFGFDSKTFEENIVFLLQQKMFHITLLSTVTSLSIRAMPTLAEKFKIWNTIRNLNWSVHLVLPVNQHILSPQYFNLDCYKESFEKTRSILASLSKKQNYLIDQYYGIEEKIKLSQTDVDKQKQLMYYLNDVDRRRNLDWRNTFPWIEQEFKKCGITK